MSDDEGKYNIARARIKDLDVYRHAAGTKRERAVKATFGEPEGLGLDGGSRAGSLVEEFTVPPFSVLDTRQGYWQTRRRAWLALGIQSELGRGASDSSAPGGSLLPAADYGVSHARGDARGRAVWRGANDFSEASQRYGGGFRNHPSRQPITAGPARTPGQDLMRGEAAAFRVGTLADGGTVGAQGATTNEAPGTSIFDPVLCECVYRWWAPSGGTVLDPFAGGSVRGIVAAYLGHPYIGIDLSGRQLEANRQQVDILPPDRPIPEWIEGDSADLLRTAPDGVDLVFSCPPYFDLEVYSNHPADLSNMDWERFIRAYETIIMLAATRLAEGRFAVFVVSEVRGPDGRYRGLVPATIAAFRRAGMHYWNELVLLNSIGSLPVRTARYFHAGRKVGRAHQNVLVFVKGDPERGWDHVREVPPDPQQGMFDAGDWPTAPPAEETGDVGRLSGARWRCEVCGKDVPAGPIISQAGDPDSGYGSCYVCGDPTAWRRS